MILFFMSFGFLFTLGSSIVLKFIYNIFPINKVTNFLSPTDDTVWSKVSISIIPILVWAFIEVPLVGGNDRFLIGLLANIFITCSVAYIVYYTYILIFKSESKIIDVIYISSSLIFGYIVNYITLLIGNKMSVINSLIGLGVICLIFVFIKIFPPNSNFFRGVQKK
ncbi:MAG: DUF6512 family protein [bacterium]|nr:DUF6512 family protein [bacterium]